LEGEYDDDFVALGLSELQLERDRPGLREREGDRVEELEKDGEGDQREDLVPWLVKVAWEELVKEMRAEADLLATVLLEYVPVLLPVTEGEGVALGDRELEALPLVDLVGEEVVVGEDDLQLDGDWELVIVGEAEARGERLADELRELVADSEALPDGRAEAEEDCDSDSRADKD
jgi:hypothetical protein